MEKKTKKRSKKGRSKILDFAPCRAYESAKQKMQAEIDQLKQRLLILPWVVFLLRVRDRISGCLLTGILGCFGCIAPMWNTLFLKTSEPNNKDKPS